MHDLIQPQPGGLLSLPGLIDCHVHFREPGFPDKGDMETESRSAIAGGVRTVCEMPNTSPPTVTAAAFADKVERAKRITDCDLRFFFGITRREHVEELQKMWKGPLRRRCSGVKLYLDHSTGNQKAEDAVLDDAFHTCAEFQIVTVVHAEDPAMNAAAAASLPAGSPHSKRRPPAAEEHAIIMAIERAAKHGTMLHIAHLSTKGGLEAVRQAKADGVQVTCEVAPHHLFLTTDDEEKLGTFGKMNPPLRTPDHRTALWAGIADGIVDCIATDHAPHSHKEKKGDPLQAPSGVPGVETMLPLLLTVTAGKWPHPSGAPFPVTLAVEDIVRLCFENPNRIFNLGKDPDENRIVIDPAAAWTIHAKNLHSKCGWTPFEGWNVVGKAVS